MILRHLRMVRMAVERAVLPVDGTMRVVEGVRRPAVDALLRNEVTRRSFMEPVGLRNSHFANIVHLSFFPICCRRTIGVFPTFSE